jgi:hypothetical protein
MAVLIFLSALARIGGQTLTSGSTPSSLIATKTPVNGPTELALDRRHHLYVIEEEAGRLLQIDLGSGLVSLVAGNGEVWDCEHADGIPGVKACLQCPQSLAVDSFDSLYIGELAVM